MRRMKREKESGVNSCEGNNNPPGPSGLFDYDQCSMRDCDDQVVPVLPSAVSDQAVVSVLPHQAAKHNDHDQLFDAPQYRKTYPGVTSLPLSLNLTLPTMRALAGVFAMRAIRKRVRLLRVRTLLTCSLPLPPNLRRPSPWLARRWHR